MSTFNHVDLAYQHIVSEVLDKGTRKENRTGVDTLSTFGVHYNLDLTRGFPLLTTKKISWKNIVVEMLWFLSGQTDISILKRHGCGFWDAWADNEGKVPSAYGNFWRHFPTHDASRKVVREHKGRLPEDYERTEEPVGTYNDQIAWVLAEMKRNPMSRRMVVSAWAPGNAQTSKLPPCHSLFIFNVQEESTKPRYMHYGHNMGRDPVCGYEGDPDAGVNGQDGKFGILPHGEGMRAPYLWCPKCQSILQGFHGAHRFQNPTEPVDLRRLCLHLTQRFGGTPFEVREVSSLAKFRVEAFEWSTGVVCVDSLVSFKPAEVSRILRGHRIYGRRALLATDGVRGALASMEISQQADIVVLVRDGIAFELKNRFEVGAPRVCSINLGGNHG